ncbi:MAG: hypothetical protein AAFN93_29195, partial [Bacteroidota bacterium]
MLKRILTSLINLGVDKSASQNAQRRTRILNVCIFFNLFLTCPAIFLQNLLFGDHRQLLNIAVAFFSIVLTLILNLRGRTQLAGLLLFTLIYANATFSVVISKVQITAPYAILFGGIGSIFLFENRNLKSTLLAISICLFIALHFYQITYLEFELGTYLPAIPFFILIGLTLSFTDRELVSHQQQIE